MHCSGRLIVQTLVFSRSYLHRQVSPPETLVVKGGTSWARNGRWILPENARLPRNIQGSFICHNLRHGINGFTSLPWKIRRPRLGLNPRTWVPKASTLPLDHRSRFPFPICNYGIFGKYVKGQLKPTFWVSSCVCVDVYGPYIIGQILFVCCVLSVVTLPTLLAAASRNGMAAGSGKRQLSNKMRNLYVNMKCIHLGTRV